MNMSASDITMYGIIVIICIAIVSTWLIVRAEKRHRKSQGIKNIAAHEEFEKEFRLTDGKIVRLRSRVEVLEREGDSK